MNAQEPVYSRPSDNEATTQPTRHRRRTRRRRGTRDVSTPATAVSGLDAVNPLHEGDVVVKRHPIHEDEGVTKCDHTTDSQDTGHAHRGRNRRTHLREKRRNADLRAENERLHRRLAAIYDALTLD